MNDNRTGGILLVVGSMAGLLTMALHPVAPHGPVTPRAMATLVLLNRTVHALAITGLPVLFLGTLALTRRLAGTGRLPLAALVVYGFASVAIMIAASLSGFVGSDLMSKIATGDSATVETSRMLLGYTFRLNQAFSSVYVVATCLAIFLWSITLTRTRRATGLGFYGLALGPVIVGFLFSGNLPLNVHGFGLVVLAQAVWFISAGILLLRSVEDGDSAPSILRTRPE